MDRANRRIQHTVFGTCGCHVNINTILYESEVDGNLVLYYGWTNTHTKYSQISQLSRKIYLVRLYNSYTTAIRVMVHFVSPEKCCTNRNCDNDDVALNPLLPGWIINYLTPIEMRFFSLISIKCPYNGITYQAVAVLCMGKNIHKHNINADSRIYMYMLSNVNQTMCTIPFRKWFSIPLSQSQVLCRINAICKFFFSILFFVNFYWISLFTLSFIYLFEFQTKT